MIVNNLTSLIALIITTLLNSVLLIYLLKNRNKTQLQKVFICSTLILVLWLIGLIMQITLSGPLNIAPINFDYFIYIEICFLPVSFLFTGMIFSKTKITFRKKYLLFFVIPTLSLLILWTNNLHHLFYENYSVNMNETTFGWYFYVHSAYTFILYFIGMFYLLKYSIKNTGIFSKQAVLTVIACIVPTVVNVLGQLNIISISIYATPICFSITILLCAIAIFKFQFLDVTPIALQKIVDRISDSFVVLDDNNYIIDYNQTLVTTFGLENTNIRGKNIEQFLKDNNISLGLKNLSSSLEDVKNLNKMLSYEQTINRINKTFTIEINSITSEKSYLGTLILFKDITQHKQDIETIQNNQEMLMESERLASLGQLIGGIAHNLKTPIMSIAGASEGLSDLTKELDASIGNPIVTNDDLHDIAKDMNEWIAKIKSYTEYMSDVITAVKGQAVTLSNDEITSFTIVELFKRVDILMRHELKKTVIYLNSSVSVPDNVSIKGDVNSLVQVINNMISNAIQSYDGKPEQFIDLIAKLDDNNHVVISIKDHGPGLPQKVKDKLFKEMITTKGKNGTGLGLYMSYSTIKAHFGGNITVESEAGRGTTFNIILPVSK